MNCTVWDTGHDSAMDKNRNSGSGTGNTTEIASLDSNVKVIAKPHVTHIPYAPQTTAGDIGDVSLSVYETAIIFNIPVRGSI